MQARLLFLICFSALPLSFVFAVGTDLEKMMQQGQLHARIIQHSESALLEESTAVEQARVQAQSRSEYGLEFRPRVSDSDVGAALRIYLPSRWNKSQLRDQLALVAKEEQLRVSALEWEEIIEAYQLFCEYRMLNRQFELYTAELARVEPYLEQADTAVQQNQLAVIDRARLYSLYLDLINNQEKVKGSRLEIERQLYLLVGPNAELSRMADSALVEMPSQRQFETMLQRALDNRADYKSLDLNARSIATAEAIARSEDGFRLKYIQPDVQVDYNNGDLSYGVSASFILPWGTRNPDIAVYQQQQIHAQSSMELQRRLISHRIQVLLKTSETYYDQAGERSARIKPLLEKLANDMAHLDTGRIEDFRDQMLVRERILDVALQTTQVLCSKEQLAVDLAKELGTLAH